MGQPRSADVYAATDGRILSLSEKTLRKISANSEIAATLLLNISKILCPRSPLRGHSDGKP